MSDRRLLIEIAADSSKFSAEVQKAAADAQQLAALVQRHGKELEKADEERANIKKALLAQLSQADRQALQEQLIDAQRHYGNLKTLYNSNKREAEAAEREVTNIVKREARERTEAARKEHDDRLGFLKAIAAGATGGLAVGGASMVFEELGRKAREAALSFIQYGHAVEHISKLMGTSTENASVLTYAFQRFGLSTDDVSRTIVQLTRHIVDNEKQFAELGVATRDVNGHLKSSFDIFQSLRGVMSDAADGTAKTALQLALASRGGSAAGQSFAELNAILSLNDEQWAALEQQAGAAGRILDEKTAKAAYDTQQQLRAASQAVGSLGLAFGQIVAGPIRWFIDGLLDAIDTLQALISLSGSLGDKIGAFFGAGPLAGAVQAQVAASKAARDALANAGEPGTGQIPDAALTPGGGGSDAAARDHIADIREEAKAREDALRDALIAFERQKNAAIAAIEAERKGRSAMHQAMVDQLQEEEKDREDAHAAAIEAIKEEQKARDEANTSAIQQIQDESRARTDAFNERQRQRDDTISGIREEIAALDRQTQAEQDLDAIESAGKALNHEQFIEINKTKGETLESFYRRQFDHEQRLTNDTQRLSDSKTKKVIDDRKAEMNAAIKAIEEVSRADRRATEDAKKNADKRIEDIRREMAEEKKKSEAAVKAIQEQEKAEKAASAAAVKNIQEQEKAEKAQSDSKIKGLRDQMTREKERVDDAVKQLQRETAAVTKELEEQLKAHQRAGAGLRDAYVPPLKAVKTAAEEAQAALLALQSQMTSLFTNAAAAKRREEEHQQAGGGDTSGPPSIVVGGQRVIVPVNNGVLNTGPGQLVLDLLGKLKDRLLNTNNTTFPGFASGGSLTLTEPTMLTGLRSGRPLGLAGEAGIETATFTPGGGSPQGGGRSGVVIHQTIVNPGMPEIETLVKRGTLAALAEADRLDEVRGYTQR